MSIATTTSATKYKMAAEPAFRGYIESTFDALLIFEACERGMCPKVTRRLHERERRLIGSGSVYVFDERDTGIKRWTDGRVWSPSRILQNFLVYRELDKRATPPNAPAATIGAEGGPVANGVGSAGSMAGYGAGPSSAGSAASGVAVPANSSPNESRSPSLPMTDLPNIDKNRERALVGSLTSSYRFRNDGLVKKTISVSGLHMISYYKMDDVLQGRLRTPSSVPELQGLEISPNFLVNQNFRVAPQIEIGADGRPRYRGEGDGTQPQHQDALASSAGYGVAYPHAPSISPHQAHVVPAPPPTHNHHSPHVAAEALQQGPSSVGPARPPYGRAHSSNDGRNLLGLSMRYDPYGRPSSSSSSYYSAAQASPTYATFGAMQEAAASSASAGQRSASGQDRGAGGMATAWPSAGHRNSYYGTSPPHSASDPRQSVEAMQQQGLYHPSHRLHPPANAYQSYDNHRASSVPPPPQSAGVYPQPGPSPRLMADQQPGPRPETAYSASSAHYGGSAASRTGSTGPQSHYHYIPSPALSAAADPRYPTSSSSLPHPSSLGSSGGYAQQHPHYSQPPYSSYHSSSYAANSHDDATAQRQHHQQQQHQSFERNGSPLLSPVTQPQRLQQRLGGGGGTSSAGSMTSQLPPLARPGSAAAGGSGEPTATSDGGSSAGGSVGSASGAPTASSHWPSAAAANAASSGNWSSVGYGRDDGHR